LVSTCPTENLKLRKHYDSSEQGPQPDLYLPLHTPSSLSLYLTLPYLSPTQVGQEVEERTIELGLDSLSKYLLNT
jgi:hypothetical protein